MNFKILASLAFLGLCFVLTGFAAMNTQHYSGSQYAKEATISLKKAEAIALQAFPGMIVAASLDRAKDGRPLHYSFGIHAQKTIHKISVDAMTGRLLENTIESQ